MAGKRILVFTLRHVKTALGPRKYHRPFVTYSHPTIPVEDILGSRFPHIKEDNWELSVIRHDREHGFTLEAVELHDGF